MQTLESGGRVPAYLQAVAKAQPDNTEVVERLANLTKTVFYGGTLSPVLKLAMGLQVAQMHKATYASAYFKRLAQYTPVISRLGERERVSAAVRYTADLTNDVHGVSDSSFASIKSLFNDAQLVELTMVTCFCNYFTRLTMGLGVEPEAWLTSTRPQVPQPTESEYAAARITLASDGEMKMGATLLERAQASTGAKNGLGIAIANSQRAMVHVPDIHEAWMGKQPTLPNPNSVSRTTMLQVSLAVSLINGCRYCTAHQVLGLRRQGVEIEKLVAMQKDDSVLTKEEKAAVDFARKLTKTPWLVNNADRDALQAVFPGSKAFDVLHQTCRFAFMNRFTDGLRLPSEDEAVKNYKEVYGLMPPDSAWKKRS